jgi:zinc protease
MRASGSLAYGADHPYGHPSNGWPESVQAITREEAVAFHRSYWKPASSALSFVGDITLAEATAIARQHFGDWSGGSAPAVDIPAPAPKGVGKVFLIDKPGAAQTVLVKVLPAPARKSPDYFPLTMANMAYGGGFSSRLNLNLRESKGYAYFAWAELEHYATTGAWFALAQVQTDKTAESATEFVKELRGLAGERPISAEELSTTRLGRIRGYPQQFESNARVARQVVDLWSARLPMSEWQSEATRLSELQLADVNAAAARYAAPAGMSMLLVGDLAKIEAKIRALKLGEVVVLDDYGNTITKRNPEQ